MIRKLILIKSEIVIMNRLELVADVGMAAVVEDAVEDAAVVTKMLRGSILGC